MATKEELKRAVCAEIDRRRDEIVRIGETILHNPETGFKEHKTASLVAERMETLGMHPQTGLALTGVIGRLQGKARGPRLAIMGELDSLTVTGHPQADPATHAAHACGHNAQIAGMLGAAMGLAAAKAMGDLRGEVLFVATPAEELIEVEERMGLVAEKKLEFLLGKPELVAKGHLDDVDLAMMIHTIANTETRSVLVDSSNGAVVKQIRFIGKPAHAGAVPQEGINALNAATIALMAINALRETFWEKDTIRIHPIVTKGGDAVNVVPAEVTIETFVRGRSAEAIMDANRKVDRCLRAGALAIGAQVEIHTIPGYLPQMNNRAMGEVFGRNVEALFGPAQFALGGHRTSSTDMGDIGHMVPTIHPYVRAAEGVIHSATWNINDREHAYVTPAKLLAMTAIDLLYDDAAPARQVMDSFKPTMTKAQYLAFQRKLFSRELYQGDAG
ncbi:MAG: amidohydrolase [Candidatus Lambdaproteobacteria bacterium]|nr:amidohydrolase [Candidatus Lambdaproteobacteria bacterium]